MKKREISKKDFDFLCELQRKINLEKSDEPVFYTLVGTEKEYGFNKDSCDGATVFSLKDPEKSWEFGEFFDYIEEQITGQGYEVDMSFTDTILNYITIKVSDETVVAISELDEMFKWLDKNAFGSYEVLYYRLRKESNLIDTVFLTEKEAEEHLKKYRDYYSSDTYVSCHPFRCNSDLQELIKLIKSVDFLKLKELEK